MDRRFFLKMAGVGLGLAGGELSASRVMAQVSGSTLVWGSSMSPSLDPHAQLDNPSMFTQVNVYDSLYIYEGKDIAPKPWLVRTVSQSSDGILYDFTLRSGVKFHDGVPLTAADAVYSLKRAINLGRQLKPVYEAIYDPNEVEQTGELSFRVKLKKPYGAFLDSLTLLAIVNSKLVEANAGSDMGATWLSGHDAGSGAYAVVEGSYRAQESLDLVRFADHFDPGKIERILLRPIKDDSTRLLALLKGDIDATTPYLRPEQIDRLLKSDDVEIVKSAPQRIFMINMNNARPPFDNRNFRKALACLFPYDLYVTRLLKGQVLANRGPIPETLLGDGWEPTNAYSYDLDKAKEHLAAARSEGADVDRPLEFLSAIGFDETLTVGQLMQSEMRKVGLDVVVGKSAYADFVKRVQNVETTPDFWSIWVPSYYYDPNAYLAPYTEATHGTTRGAAWYSDKQTEEMIQKASQTTNAEARQKLYRDITERLLDQSPSIWIYNGGYVRGVRSRVEGFQPDAIGDGVRVSKLTISG
ncbi:ABC transporter substrate-binding protein [Mesorhizobium sp. 1B3]|uniref:ABC transporter substrate-binding protein n=1 Tax=Mesorhizobium sp. 1B3 TaxID=3243599 RepID=UPI003D96C6FA